MAGGLGKRERLARGLLHSGINLLLSRLPEPSLLLVLNYHRIGTPQRDDLFDPGVFSATEEQFSEQISDLKRRLAVVSLDEALAFIDGREREKARRCRVLVTFDDGYRDNYEVAYPILRAQGVQGVFFLATSMVGSCLAPWWDRIAYLIKTAHRRRFTLRYPEELAVDMDRNGVTESLQAVLKLYKTAGNSDSARFIRELAEAARGEEMPRSERRFLSWDEAREMIRGGMAIGSHTHSHPVLSQLQPERQLEELAQSRAILQEQLGVEAEVLAYPVGGRASFTGRTQSLAREAGYRAAFSFYGGTNLAGKISAYDVRRVGISGQSRGRFQVRAAMCRATGCFWP